MSAVTTHHFPPESSSVSGESRPSYFSSTNTVTLTISLFQFSDDSLENSFAFALRYKILPANRKR